MLTFLAYWLLPAFGAVFALCLLSVCIFVLILKRTWRMWKSAIPLGALTFGILLSYVAFLHFTSSSDTDFTLVTHFVSDFWVSPDHLISFLFSDRLAQGSSTHLLIGDWNGSDRPPLAAGFLLLNRPLSFISGSPSNSAFGAGIVAQVLWVPALYAFLRALGAARTPALFGVLLAGSAGTSLVNTLYTWPKLMSAALVLCSGAALFSAIRRRSSFGPSFVLAVVLFDLAMLAHGAAGFTLPFVIALGLSAYRRQSRRSVVLWTAVAAGAGAILYAPWVLYQRFVDPPGDRLLKWHLAGVIPASDHRSFPEALIDSFRGLSFTDWISGRIANIGTALPLNPFVGPRCPCDDPFQARRNLEFYSTTGAIGIAFPLIIVIAIVIVVRKIRTGRVLQEDRQFLYLVQTSMLCIIFWCLAVFIPGETVVHQGSHLWVLLLLACPVVWLAKRHRMLAAIVVVVQLASTIILYTPNDGEIRIAAVATYLVALAMCSLAAFAIVRRSPRARSGADAHASESPLEEGLSKMQVYEVAPEHPQ